KFYALQRFIVMILANSIIPLYFRISGLLNRRSYALANNNSNDLIVSLTSFPARIDRLWLVVECILRQSYKPDRIILWLSKEQFTTVNELPKSLLEQRSRGLE